MDQDTAMPRRAASGRSGPVERRRRARRALGVLVVASVAAAFLYANSVGDDQPGASALSGELEAVDDTAVTAPSSPVVVDVLANDSGDADPSTLALVTPPEHGVVSTVDTVTGTIVYEPAAGFTGTDTFTYSLDEVPGTAFDVRTLATGATPGGPVDAGAVDPNWRVADDLGDPGQPAVAVTGDGTWSPAPAGTSWLCGPSCSDDGDATAVFHRSFQIPDAHTAARAVLTFDVYADGGVDGVWLNGEDLGVVGASPTSPLHLVVTGGDGVLVEGTNTLSIRVRHGEGAAMGLLVVPGSGDEDGDGVPDHADRCLGTPEDVTVNDIGCRRELATVSIEVVADAATTTTVSGSTPVPSTTAPGSTTPTTVVSPTTTAPAAPTGSFSGPGEGRVDARVRTESGASTPTDELTELFPGRGPDGLPAIPGGPQVVCRQSVADGVVIDDTTGSLPCGVVAGGEDATDRVVYDGIVELPPDASSVVLQASNRASDGTFRESLLSLWVSTGTDPTGLSEVGTIRTRRAVPSAVEFALPLPPSVCATPPALPFRLYWADPSHRGAVSLRWSVDGGPFVDIPASRIWAPGTYPYDADGDGIADHEQVDTDGDGVPDHVEVRPVGPGGDLPPDADGDGTPDCADTDSDDDGVPDGADPHRTAAVARDDAATTSVDDEITVDVVANDDAAHADDVELEIVGTTGLAGDAEVDGDGIRVDPDDDDGGSEAAIRYRVCNPETGVCAEATLYVAVTPTGPEASDVTVVLDEDGGADGDLSDAVDPGPGDEHDGDDDGDDEGDDEGDDHDGDDEGDGHGDEDGDDEGDEHDGDDEGDGHGDDGRLVFELIDGPEGFELDEDGEWDYEPPPDVHGGFVVTWRVCNGGGICDTAELRLVVEPVDDPPVAVDDDVTTDEDTPVVVDVLANDTDPDGDPLTLIGVGDPDHGSADIEDEGRIVYTPDPGYSGVDAFTYEIGDGHGDPVSATVHVAVALVDDPPVAVDDDVTTDEDTPVVVDVLANDTDDGDDPLSIRTLGTPAHGTVVLNGGGLVTYTPDADYDGGDSFSYEVADDRGGTATATVVVTVLAVDDAPVALADGTTTAEDTPVVVDVLANDTDPDGDALVVAGLGDPAHGTVTVAADGRVTYTPEADFAGTDSFTYTVTDGTGLGDSALVTVTVTPVNDTPVAGDDTTVTDEDTPVVVDVLADDTDPDGDALVVAGLGDPAHGTVTVGADGRVTYTPEADFAGTDSFTYTVTDPAGASDEATVTVTVRPVNDPPVAVDDAVSTDEDTAVIVDVLADDTDVDGDALTLVAVTDPPHGSVVGLPDGTLRYLPDADFAGTDAFTYEIADGHGATATATVSVTVEPVNDTPVAGDDSLAVTEDTATAGSVAANDGDVDGDPLAWTLVEAPTLGRVEIDPADGSYVFEPLADAVGVDVFRYRVTDPDGEWAEATVRVTIGAVNDAPVAVADTWVLNEDTGTTGDPAADDTDVDGDVLAVTAVGPASHGRVDLGPDGLVTYTPDPEFSGTDSFAYTVADGVGATDSSLVRITVTPVDDPPVAGPDEAVLDEDTSVVIDVLANDTDADGDELRVEEIEDEPEHGTAVVGADGTVTYTPDPDYAGRDSFTYDVVDPTGLEDEGVVEIEVRPVDDDPVVADQSFAGPEDAPVSGRLVAADADGDELVFVLVEGPVRGAFDLAPDGAFTFTPDPDDHGTFTAVVQVSDGEGAAPTATVTVIVVPVNDPPLPAADAATTAEDTPVVIEVLANDTDIDGDILAVGSLGSPGHGRVRLNGDGTVDYTPDRDWFGTDSFTYRVGDGTDEAVATVTVTVSPVNDPPVAGDDGIGTDEDTVVVFDPLTNDIDADGDTLTVVAVTDPPHGAATLTGDGRIRYYPDLDFAGTDAFTYTVEDRHGDRDTATVTVAVGPVNDDPVAADDSVVTDEDTPVVIDVLANDADVDGDPLRVSAVGTTALGGITLTSAGTLRYTPDPDVSGIETVHYTVVDDRGGQDTARLTIEIVPVDDPPVARGTTLVTDEDVTVGFDLAPLVQDVDGDTLTFSVDTDVASGRLTLARTGAGSYVPDPDTHGRDAFVYRVADGHGGVATATVTIGVNPVPDAPVVADDTATTDEDTPVVIDVLANDGDPDGDALTVTGVEAAGLGGVVVNPDGSVTYTPDPDANGVDTFRYHVEDPTGLGSDGLVTVEVRPVNDTPVAGDDGPVTVIAGTTAGGDVAGNDGDVDGDPLTWRALTVPTVGTFALAADGTWVWDVPADAARDDHTVPYEVCDPHGACDPGTLTLGIERWSDLAVTQTVVPSIVPGTVGVVELEVVAAGPSVSDGVVVTVTPPDGTSIDMTADGADPRCSLLTDGSAVCVEPGPIDPGSSLLLEVPVAVPPDRDSAAAPGSARVAPTAADPALDPDPGNDTTDVAVGVAAPLADVALVDVVVTDPAPGGGGVVEVTTRTNGPSTAAGWSVRVDLPGGLAPDDTGAGLPAACAADATGVTCTVAGPREPGAEATFVVPVVADPTVVGPYGPVTVTVTGQLVTDPDPANDGPVEIVVGQDLSGDADGDGLFDADELDVDDGRGGAPDGLVDDSDSDGTPDWLDRDSDGDGVDDGAEAPGGLPLDSDADGRADHRDPDSDGDGIGDAVEAAAGIEIDSDSDGVPDRLDRDSDGDGVPDSVEGTADPDGDGVGNWRDPDSDGDGLADSVEAGPDPLESRDSDGDGTPDRLDPDSDADGFPDAAEIVVDGRVVTQPDGDGDGVPDWRDPTPLIDVWVRIVDVSRPDDADEIIYLLEVGNDGPFPAAGTVFTFTSPAGTTITGVEHRGWRTDADAGAGHLFAGPAADPVCTTVGTRANCELGTVEDAWISTLVVTARVDRVAEELVATATVTGIGHDVDLSNNTVSLAVRSIVTALGRPLPAQLAFTGVRFGLGWWLLLAALLVSVGVAATVAGDRRRRHTGHA